MDHTQNVKTYIVDLPNDCKRADYFFDCVKICTISVWPIAWACCKGVTPLASAMDISEPWSISMRTISWYFFEPSPKMIASNRPVHPNRLMWSIGKFDVAANTRTVST